MYWIPHATRTTCRSDSFIISQCVSSKINCFFFNITLTVELHLSSFQVKQIRVKEEVRFSSPDGQRSIRSLPRSIIKKMYSELGPNGAKALEHYLGKLREAD